MSQELFLVEQSILNKELALFQSFLQSNLQDYTFEKSDVEPLRLYFKKIQSNIEADIGKAFEDLVKRMLINNWKTIFEADNYIDTERTNIEQRQIIEEIIQSIETTGRVSNLPPEIETNVNTHFLDSEYRKQLLLAELRAELALTNESISWIDATLERAKVMYYSALLVMKQDEIQNLAEKIYSKDFSLFFGILTEKDIEYLVSQVDLPSEELTMYDALKLFAVLSISISISDDYMDLEEDTQNDKITGITQIKKSGLDPKILHGTMICYLETRYSKVTQIESIQRWFRELTLLAHEDYRKCVELCKEVSPYLFSYFFQRK